MKTMFYCFLIFMVFGFAQAQINLDSGLVAFYPFNGNANDLSGNEIATLVDEEKSAGIYKVNFSSTNSASGVYLYKLQAGGFVETRKMILVR
jgi:hypothetical protein